MWGHMPVRLQGEEGGHLRCDCVSATRDEKMPDGRDSGGGYPAVGGQIRS